VGTPPIGHVAGTASSSRTGGGACGWPLSHLTEAVGDSSCLLLSGAVAVLGCCIVTARSLQGMACVRSGQAPPGPWFLAGVSAEAPGSSVTSRVRSPGTLGLCSLSCGHSNA
jgi:hypothetical protein